MDIRFAIVVCLLLAAPGAADYLQSVVANFSTGVATFNGTLASGNSTWTLSHQESGAVTASQIAVPFTNAVGLIANYGGTYGNLTGNFTFAFTLNVSLGTFNNSSFWATETKSSGFQISGPAPTPAPNQTPAPVPAPVTGDMQLYVLTPDLVTTYRDRLPVSAVATATNNTTVAEVRMVIENREPRAAPPGQTPCDAVPAGWKVGVATNGTYSRTWDLNSTDAPLRPGLYTVYVRAVNSGGKVACQVVPDVAVKQDVAAPAPTVAPGASPSAEANATVVATSCPTALPEPKGPPVPDKPCPQGLRGPLTKGREFRISLSVVAKMALCGPFDMTCKRQGAQEKHTYLIDADGTYCAQKIDPTTDAISGKMRLSDGSEACWSTGSVFTGGSNRLAPGLNSIIQKADDIPCQPVPGYLRKETRTDESGGVVNEERTQWVLRPGFDKKTLCKANHPVYWTVYIAATCPTALSIPGLITQSSADSRASPGTLTAGNPLRGVLYSRAQNPDGSLGAWGAAKDFAVPLPCTGRYEVQTLEVGDDPDKDAWSSAYSFEVNEGPGWDWVDWTLRLVPTIAFLVIVFWLLYAIPEFSVEEKGEDGRLTDSGILRGFRLVTVYHSKRCVADNGEPRRAFILRKTTGRLTKKLALSYKVGLVRDFKFSKRLAMRLCIHSRFPVRNDPVNWGAETRRLDWEPGGPKVTKRNYDVYGGNKVETNALWEDLRTILAGEQHAEFAIEKSLRSAYGAKTATEEAMDARTRTLQKDSDAMRAALHGEAPKGETQEP